MSVDSDFKIWPYSNSAANIDFKTDGSVPQISTATATPLGIPVATAATAISTTGFTANWGAVVSATGYELDVYTKEGVATNTTSILNNPGTNNVNGTATQIGVDGWTYTNISSTASYIKMVKNGTGDAPSIISPTMNLTNYATLTYDMTGGTFGGTDATANALNLYVSTNNGDTWSSAIAITVSGNSESGAVADVDLSAYVGNSQVKIKLEATGATTEIGVRAKSITLTGKQYILTSIAGSPFSTTETSKTVTGLTANSAYYYSVNAKNGSATSASSNVITAFTAIDGAVSASAMADCPTCDVTVATGGTLTLNASKTYNSVTVAPGAKLTLQNGNTFSPGTFVLQSSESGTATFVDERTHANKTDITATVQQYLPQGRNWYVGIPIVSGSAGTLTAAGLSTSVSYWNEAASAWVNSYTETLTPGVGYIGVSAAGSGTNNVSFTGNLNTGNINVALTRKGTSSIGYNLVANPYPSYLNAMAAINANANVQKTIWYRTRSTGQTPLYKFETVNTTSGVGTNAAGTGTVTGYVPPMQAFWVRTLTDDNAITFTNTMRYHANPTVDTVTIATTPLKAPSNTGNKLVRLEVAKGSATDETVIYFHPNAATGFDDYDSPKRSNESVAIPELYTIASAETLAINGLPEIVYNTELPLGFNAGAESVYSIRAKELRNMDADVRVILKDGAVEYDLTNGDAYEFSSAVYNSANRFSIIFRSSGTVSGIDNTALNTSTHVFVNANGELMVKTSAPLSADARVAVFNAVGQQISIQALRTGTTSFKLAPTAGMYLVKITSNGATVTRRVMVN